MKLVKTILLQVTRIIRVVIKDQFELLREYFADNGQETFEIQKNIWDIRICHLSVAILEILDVRVNTTVIGNS